MDASVHGRLRSFSFSLLMCVSDQKTHTFTVFISLHLKLKCHLKPDSLAAIIHSIVIKAKPGYPCVPQSSHCTALKQVFPLCISLYYYYYYHNPKQVASVQPCEVWAVPFLLFGVQT